MNAYLTSKGSLVSHFWGPPQPLPPPACIFRSRMFRGIYFSECHHIERYYVHKWVFIKIYYFSVLLIISRTSGKNLLKMEKQGAANRPFLNFDRNETKYFFFNTPHSNTCIGFIVGDILPMTGFLNQLRPRGQQFLHFYECFPGRRRNILLGLTELWQKWTNIFEWLQRKLYSFFG